MPLIELIAGTRMRVLEAQSTGFIYLDLGETPRHDFEIHYRNFPGDMRWELFNLDLEPMNYLERAEIEGRQLTDEKNSKIMLRVDKQESDDAIYLLGSQMVFSDASFEAFNECFMFALRGLTRVPDLSISVADFLKLRCPQPMRLATAN